MKSKVSDAQTTVANTRIKKGDWLMVPLAMLTLLCGYHIVSTWRSPISLLPGSLIGFFMAPLWTSLLATTFSVIYIYKTVRRAPRHIVAKVVAYVLSFITIAVGLFASFRSDQYFVFWVFFFNPYVTPIVVVASIGGIVASLMPARK